MYRERECLFWRSAKRKHQGEREKSCWYVSGGMYKKPQSETGNKRLREPHKTRSAKRISATEQKREQRTHAAPKNSSSLSSLAAHYPTSSPSYSRPVQCCPPQPANWNREPGHAWPRREPVPNSPGAGRKLQLGPGYDCCHGYHAEGCHVAPQTSVENWN